MDEKAAAKRYAELERELASTYPVITGLLARLPIPVLLPLTQAADPDETVQSMSRTWEVLDWEPLTKLEVGRARDMLTAWLTAYELARSAKTFGFAFWRLRGIEAALLRVRSCAYYINQHLTEYGR